MKKTLWFFSFLLCNVSFAQTPTNQEKIKTLLDSYFSEDREIIHVQFNKNTYLNNEDIAFKGYVFSRNNNAPHPLTANVQLTIYNEKQEEVKKQLLYVTNGSFVGGIHLNKNFRAGKYLFHFYTNWMNNFKEDDSFSQTIEIFDITEPFVFKSNQPNWNSAKIDFFPEGGNIIDGISNTVGVKIKDCNNKGLEIKNATIFDSKSNEVGQFNTDKNGNGSLSFIADINEKYKLKIEAGSNTISQDLPLVKPTGIAISCNTNLPQNKFAIAVKTNEQGVANYQNKKLNLIIQQNGYSALKEIDFSNNANEQVLILDKSFLSPGVNSIRLIDENLNEISERLVYHFASAQPKLELNATVVSNDSIVLSSLENLSKARISTSILPEKSVCIDNKGSIIGTFYLNAYLENPEIDNFTYFDAENKLNKREIDVLMLNQKRSKFLWDNIKSNPQVINFKFTKGLTISGLVNNKLNHKVTNNLNLISIKNNVFEQIAVEKDNTFKLENYFVQDSTVYVLQLENEKNAAIISKVVAKVQDNQTKFNLPLKFNKIVCPIPKTGSESITFSASKVNIELDEVIIKQKKKEVMIHSAGISTNATGHKIDSREVGTILDFIGRNGFRTGVVQGGDAFIAARREGFQSGAPEVFLDNVFLFDFNILFDLDIDTVDEIYIDKTGVATSRINSSGVIKIFLKRGNDINFYTSKTSKFIATSGFTKKIDFKNAKYFTEKEFNAFGTMNWSDKALKENEKLQFKFARENQKVIQVLIEGFTADGQVISEFKKIALNAL